MLVEGCSFSGSFDLRWRMHALDLGKIPYFLRRKKRDGGNLNWKREGREGNEMRERWKWRGIWDGFIFIGFGLDQLTKLPSYGSLVNG